MNPFSSTDLLERRVSHQAEPWQAYCLLRGNEPEVAQVVFSHAVCLHQARDIINGYTHLFLFRERKRLCECMCGPPLDTQDLVEQTLNKYWLNASFIQVPYLENS